MNEKLQQIADTMALDGYALEVTEAGEMRVATITAGEGICGDCLVPKVVMTNLLAKALEVPADRIELHYPADLEEAHLVG
jgi:hypothetical protein